MKYLYLLIASATVMLHAELTKPFVYEAGVRHYDPAGSMSLKLYLPVKEEGVMPKVFAQRSSLKLTDDKGVDLLAKHLEYKKKELEKMREMYAGTDVQLPKLDYGFTIDDFGSKPPNTLNVVLDLRVAPTPGTRTLHLAGELAVAKKGARQTVTLKALPLDGSVVETPMGKLKLTQAEIVRNDDSQEVGFRLEWVDDAAVKIVSATGKESSGKYKTQYRSFGETFSITIPKETDAKTLLQAHLDATIEYESLEAHMVPIDTTISIGL